MIELQGDDLRDEPLLKRKQRLAKILARGGEAITFNEHLNHDGANKPRSTTMQKFFCDMMRRCSVQRSDWKTNADAICTLRSRPRSLGGRNGGLPRSALVFEHGCRLGLGIVSKRLDSPYRSGPSKDWLKSKNPLSEAVRREREEDWA